ncbi:carboxypeptidase regulatory-like domain-containing protein [Natrarchaeobius chitinivorans]|uniref:CARDB domain-containing protein n=1 Tax=Natrarchaeobius chitinivorans TaxID=1679083 RepID=A0A3N6MRF8_NATCH|nr:carboxypeptidase regulatory-like domain-containing protein [Natrarchaeobius chitinivorans]RQG97246.1 hypothetical protein EA473_04040 [Natrarchaeobius chitinivorans]
MVILGWNTSWQRSDVFNVIGIVVLCGLFLVAGGSGVAIADADREIATDLAVAVDGEPTADVELEREKSSITGVVVDGDGKSVSGVEVGIVHLEDDFSETTTTDEHGEFTVAVPEGRLSVTAEMDGYFGDIADVDVSTGEQKAVELEIHAIETGTVTGQVTTEDGAPISDADVEVVEQVDVGQPDPAEDGFTTTTSTDESGAFEVDVPPGAYKITVVALGYDDGFRQNLEIGAGEHEDLDFELSPVPVLSGTVTDSETGDPIEGVELESRLTGNNPLYTATTNADGEYSINLPEDTLSTVEFDADGYFTKLVDVDEAHVGDAPTIDVELHPVPETGTVEGYVTTEDGTPVWGAQVVVADSQMPGVITDESGWYELEVETGTHTIQVNHESPEFPQTVEGVEVTEGDTTRVDIGTDDPELEVLEVGGLPDELETGENVTITATVENVGEADGELVVPLEVDGEVADHRTVDLAVGNETDVEFTHAFDSSGEYDVSVGGVGAGTVTVLASADVTIFGASVDRSELLVDETATITANLYNSGDVDGTLTIELRAEGEQIGEESIANETFDDVEPGITRDAVEFEWDLDEEAFEVDSDTVTLTLNDQTVDTLPLEHSFTDIQVIAASADAEEIVQDETFYVTGSIYQAGTIDGPQEIALNATHQETEETVPLTTTEEISLTPGWYYLGGLNLSASFDEEMDPGTYELTLGDRSAGTIEVSEAYSDVQVIAASADAEEVVQNETFHVVGSIYQNGTTDDPQSLTLNATHQETEETVPLSTTEEISLTPGWYYLGGVNVSASFNEEMEPGTYELTLGDRDVGEVEVLEAYSDLEVIAASADAEEVVQNETFHVVGSIYQNGTTDDPQRLALNATPVGGTDGETETLNWSEETELGPGWYYLGGVNVSASFDEEMDPGTYELTLGDRDVGEVEVLEAYSDLEVIAASADAEEVVQNETFHVVGSIYQNGTTDDPQTLALNATHQETEKTETLNWSEETELRPGWYHLGGVNVSASFGEEMEPGTYELTLGDRDVGEVEVLEAYSDLEVIAASADAEEVVQNETFHVVGSIYQNGTTDDPQRLALNATPVGGTDGETETLNWSEETELRPGWYHLGGVNVSASFDEEMDPGTYELTLGDRHVGEIAVIEAYSDIQVIAATPSEMNVTESETFHVTGSIYQNGTTDGPQEIALNATPVDGEDGETVTLNETEVTLDPGWYYLGGVNVSASFDEFDLGPGRYDLTLGGHDAGTIGVEESPSDVQVIAASLSEIEVVEDENLSVVGSVYQNGTANGGDWTETVPLTATPTDGNREPMELGAQEVDLEPGTYHLGAINISFSIDEPGTYDLELGGHDAGTLEVLEAKSDIRVIAASADAEEVVQGDSFNVVGSTYQNGTIEGPQEIALNATPVGGSADESVTLTTTETTLDPGFYHLGGVNVTAAIDEEFPPGTYELTLGDRSVGEVEVLEAASDITVIAGSADVEEVVQGESFNVVGSTYQNGTIDGPQEIALNATHQETEETVALNATEETLTPGWYYLGGLNLSATIDDEMDPGTYDLELGDRDVGEIEILEAKSDIRVIAASADAEEVVQGDSFHVVGSTYQNGTIDGPQEIALNATRQGTEETLTLNATEETLTPGWYYLGGLNLSATIDEEMDPGTYDLELGDRDVGEIEVLEAASDVTVIAASADAEDVAHGETFHVVGSIYQSGTIEGPDEVALTAVHDDSGETVTLNTAEDVSLTPGWYHLGGLNVSAAFDSDAAGTYELFLGDRNAGTVTVSEPQVEVTAVDIEGASAGVDHDLEYASDDPTVSVTVDSDLPIEEVYVFVESQETTFFHEVEATHVAGEVWSAEIPIEGVLDDGAYDVSALAIDEFDTPGELDADRTLVVDTEDPSLSVSIEDISSEDATIVVESSDPLEGVPDVDATFDDGGDEPTVTMDSGGMGGTTYTGTIEFDESGNYSITATGTDLAGNTAEDSTSAVIFTGFSIADDGITIDATGTTIEFDVADDAVVSDELFLAFSESAVDANVDDSHVGVGFLSAEMDDVLHDYMDDGTVAGATISMPIDESELPGDAVAEDVKLQYYDEVNDAWDPVAGSDVDRAGDDPFVTATVPHFSTYGAVVPDTTDPELTVVESPANGAVFDPDTEGVDFEFTFEDPYSGIDSSSVTLEVDGVDRTEDFTYNSSWLEGTLDVEDGTAYDVVLSVSDEAGNEATHEVDFEVASSSTGSPGGGSNGGGSGGSDGGSSPPPADDDTSQVDEDESPVSDDDGDDSPVSDDDGDDSSVSDDDDSVRDGASAPGDDSATSIDETGHDDDSETPGEGGDDVDADGDSDSVPGFGVVISIFVVLLAAVRLAHHPNRTR